MPRAAGTGGGAAAPLPKVLGGAGVGQRPVLPHLLAAPSPKTCIRPPLSSSQWTLLYTARR